MKKFIQFFFAKKNKLQGVFIKSLHGNISKKISGLSLFTISMFLSQAVMMLYALILARYLGPEKYGYYASGYSLIGLWSFFINFGMDTWMLQKERKRERYRDWYEEILKTKFRVFIFWAPIILLLITFLKKGAISPLFLLVCALDIFLDCNLTTYIYALNIKQRYDKITQVLLVSRLGRLVGLILFIALQTRDPLFFALSRLFFTGLGVLFASQHLPVEFHSEFNKSAIPFKEVLPFGLSEIFAQVYVVADVSLLAILAGDRQVGLYNPASQIISGLLIIPSTVHISLIPIVKKRLDKIFSKYFFFLLGVFGIIGIFLSVGLIIGSNWVIHLVLGKAYGSSSALMTALSPIIFLKSLQFGFATIIVSGGLQKFRLVPQAIAAILNVSMNFFLIPVYGAFGAAVAYNLSEAFLLIGYSLLIFLFAKKGIPGND